MDIASVGFVRTSALSNVQVALYALVYDSTVRTHVISDTPLAERLIGHLDVQRLQLEGTFANNSDRNRSTSHVLRLNLPLKAVPEIKDGTLIVVTATRHPVTKRWVHSSATERFIVQRVEQAVPNTLDYNLYLVQNNERS